MEDFTPQYTILGNDRGFRDESDLTLYLQATVGDLLNENLQYDNFIRGADGRYYVLALDLRIKELDAGQSAVMAAMDQQGLIPKGLGVSRAQLLDAFYDVTKEIGMLENACDDAEMRAVEYDDLLARLEDAQTRLAVVRSKLIEIDLAREKNQAEVINPPSEKEMMGRAATLGQLERKREGIAEAVAIGQEAGLPEGPPPELAPDLRLVAEEPLPAES